MKATKFLISNGSIMDLELLLTVYEDDTYNLVTDLNNYQPNSPWKKEVRTASNTEVIQSSIEKNSINFWWVRVFHWKPSLWSKIFSILVLINGLIGFIILIRYVKRKII